MELPQSQSPNLEFRPLMQHTPEHIDPIAQDERAMWRDPPSTPRAAGWQQSSNSFTPGGGHQALHGLLLTFEQIFVDLVLGAVDLVLVHAVAEHVEGEHVGVPQDPPGLRHLVGRLEQQLR